MLMTPVAFVKANEDAAIAADDDPFGLAKTLGQAHRARLASEQAAPAHIGRPAGPTNHAPIKRGMLVGPRATSACSTEASIDSPDTSIDEKVEGAVPSTSTPQVRWYRACSTETAMAE